MTDGLKILEDFCVEQIEILEFEFVLGKIYQCQYAQAEFHR